jgi:hypothetical protein
VPISQQLLWRSWLLQALIIDHSRFPSHPPIRSPKIFRFEASWNVSNECAEVIKKAWSEEGNIEPSSEAILKKLRHCQEALSSWSSSKFGSFSRSLKVLTRRLEGLQNRENPGNLEEIKNLQQEINLSL